MNEQQVFLVRKAMFDFCVAESLGGVDGDQFKAVTLAVSKRLAFMRAWLGVQDVRSLLRPNLVASCAVMNALARIPMHAAEWRQAEESASIFFYAWYCSHLASYATALQTSVKAGALTVREPASGAPCRADDLAFWLSVDMDGHLDLSPWLLACADWVDSDSRWPDRGLFPPGALVLDDVATWVESSGLCGGAEMFALLGRATGSVTALVSGGAPTDAPSQAAALEWTDEAVLEAYEKLVRLGGVYGSQKKLITLTGIGDRELRRMRDRAAKARNEKTMSLKTPIGAMADALKR
jgi:hypothetical protein